MTISLEELPSQLYHYTTAQGLEGILKSQSLWATNYRFLNDYTEVVLFKNKMLETLIPRMEEYFKQLDQNVLNKSFLEKKGGIEKCAEAQARDLANRMYEGIEHEIFITSFSALNPHDPFVNENGLLSQWRSYGKDGGYAIVFDTKKLDMLRTQEIQKFSYTGGYSATVVYSDDCSEFEKELAISRETVMSFCSALCDTILNKPTFLDDWEGYKAFITCIGRYKHHGFKEENEIRIVMVPVSTEQNEEAIKEGKYSQPSSTIKPRKCFIRNGTFIPYIDLFSEQKKEDSNFRLPIDKVIVGPHKDKELRKESLKILLKNYSMNETKVEVQKFPL